MRAGGGAKKYTALAACVRLLTDSRVSGAQVDKIDRTDYGANALMYASMYDHQDMAKKLLSAGADTSRLSVTHFSPLDAHWSAYAWAAWFGTDKVRYRGLHVAAASCTCAHARLSTV